MKTILIGRLAVLAVLAASAPAAGCGTSTGTGGAAPGTVEVVAAENVWGSLASQLGGDHAHVTSIITNPDTDPHSYQPTPGDGRAVAQAGYVIANGAGYDPWAQKLVDANPASGRTVLSVARLVGRAEGDNPHFWYSPDYVSRVVDRITADLDRLDPGDAGYFDQRRGDLVARGFGGYTRLVGEIKQRYGGVPVGATESVFSYLADATGLTLLTPPGYLRAISEGTEPSAGDKATVDQQVAQHRIRVLVFNRQNSTTDVGAVVSAAHAAGIPVVPITETLEPATASFQDWQSAQLSALEGALRAATGA